MATQDASRRTAGRQALRWLREVDGRLMRRREDPPGPDGWVAIVKTPAATGQRAQLILAFGDSAVAAAETAQQSWEHAWRGQRVH